MILSLFSGFYKLWCEHFCSVNKETSVGSVEAILHRERNKAQFWNECVGSRLIDSSAQAAN